MGTCTSSPKNTANVKHAWPDNKNGNNTNIAATGTSATSPINNNNANLVNGVPTQTILVGGHAAHGLPAPPPSAETKYKPSLELSTTATPGLSSTTSMPAVGTATTRLLRPVLNGAAEFPLAIVEDPDDSKMTPDHHRCIMKHGMLYRDEKGTYSVNWQETWPLTTDYSFGDRVAQLSDIQYHSDGQLYAVCNRTGIVFKISPERKLIASHVVADGDGGSSSDGAFAGQWIASKDGSLMIGSFGSLNDGREKPVDKVERFAWVKSIDSSGKISHINWERFYESVAGAWCKTTGFMSHQAVRFDPYSREWLFMPRRASKDQPYNEKNDTSVGGNILLIASEDFERISVREIGGTAATLGRGFSSFTFVPGSTHIAGVRCSNVNANGNVESYITVFDRDTGRILLADTLIGRKREVQSLWMWGDQTEYDKWLEQGIEKSIATP